MEKPIFADSLDDFFDTKMQLGFPLKYIQAGLALWNAEARCVYVSEYIRKVFGMSPEPSKGSSENLAELMSLDLITSPKQSSSLRETAPGWSLKRTYITDSGVVYLEIVVKAVRRNADNKLLGYMSVFQDVTSRHEPRLFQEKLYEMLRCSIKSTSNAATTQQIYACIEMMGFRDMSVVLFDEKTNKLELFSRVIRGKEDLKTQTWQVDQETSPANRLVQLTQNYLKTQKVEPFIQNEPDLGWAFTKPPFTCLPIVLTGRLIGYLVLGQSHSLALTPGLVDSGGRTSRFLEELAPVFNRMFVEPRKIERSRKWSTMKDKLESMNLNQKQIQILEMIVKGETNKGIANIVNLSEQGVKYHVGNLLEIFSTRNRSELRTKIHELLQPV